MGYLKVKTVERPSDGFKFECLDKASAVACVIFNSDYSKVLLVKQFRAGANKDIYELPAGVVDEGEDFKTAMLREVEEETGFRADQLSDICDLGSFYVSPGYTSEVMSLWCARVHSGVVAQAQKLCGEEQIVLEWMTLHQIKNTVDDMKTQLGLSRALERPKKRIGIFGGTFNPTTFLHLSTGERAVEELNLHELVFEPVATNYAKKDIIAARHRISMLRAAVRNNDKFKCGDYEVFRGQSVSLDTLKHYQNIYGWADIFFICGSDVLRDMTNWPKTAQLLEGFDVVCVTT